MVRNILVSQISGNVLVLEKILPSREVLNSLYLLTCLVSYLTSVRGWIQNFPDWCRHLHSSCVSAKHRYMVGQPCLASLLAKFHVGEMA